MDYLNDLCALNASSGEEGSVRDYIISHLKNTDYKIDRLGNIIVEKKGELKPYNKIMLAAHMDEVGFIITYIDETGFLKFDCVGGIQPGAALGKRVVINGINGVIGTVPVHLCRGDKEKTIPDISEMYIDIGAENKRQAEKYVSLGDRAYFACAQGKLGNNEFCSKALDDRFGCALLLELCNSKPLYDITVCFTVMEEVGLRGAGAAANLINPDIAVIVESTTANDLCAVSGDGRVCTLGGGAVVSFMDGRTVYDKGLYDIALQTAKESGIKVQTKTKIAGGNDAGAVQRSGEGVRVCAVSLPTRYIHSSCCVANKEDMESVHSLIYALIKSFGELN